MEFDDDSSSTSNLSELDSVGASVIKADCGNGSFLVGLEVGLKNDVGRCEGCADVAHTVVLDGGVDVGLLVGLFVVGLLVGPLEGLDVTIVICAGGGSLSSDHTLLVGFQISGED